MPGSPIVPPVFVNVAPGQHHPPRVADRVVGGIEPNPGRWAWAGHPEYPVKTIGASLMRHSAHRQGRGGGGGGGWGVGGGWGWGGGGGWCNLWRPKSLSVRRFVWASGHKGQSSFYKRLGAFTTTQRVAVEPGHSSAGVRVYSSPRVDRVSTSQPSPVRLIDPSRLQEGVEIEFTVTAKTTGCFQLANLSVRILEPERRTDKVVGRAGLGPFASRVVKLALLPHICRAL